MANSKSNQQPIENVLNIAAYKFTPLTGLQQRREPLRRLCTALELKGTILLSREGINLFVAGQREAIDTLRNTLEQDTEIGPLVVKESWSVEQPFNRMLVRLKKEIIAFDVEGIDPGAAPSRKISAMELQRWLDNGRRLTLLDVRNQYEVRLGTFQDAVTLPIDHFRQFPAVAKQLPEEAKGQPLVMFCTGGIRCEKAGPYLEREGFEEVYQLEGGILKYFEQCGKQYFEGECFVFDQRVAVTHGLLPSENMSLYQANKKKGKKEILS